MRSPRTPVVRDQLRQPELSEGFVAGRTGSTVYRGSTVHYAVVDHARSPTDACWVS